MNIIIKESVKDKDKEIALSTVNEIIKSNCKDVDMTHSLGFRIKRVLNTIIVL